MRGSGLTFADLAIENDEFQTTISSSRGTITLFKSSSAPSSRRPGFLSSCKNCHDSS